jgi:2,3-bisphosphoglycerate-dependent phosphoglycerate mutase
VLIRHGESQAQVEGFFSGHDTCKGLSDRGRHQARLLHDRLAQTGEQEPRAECDWCEVHAGDAEGLTYEEARERFELHWYSQSPFARIVPGGETMAEFAVRAGTRLERVAREHEGECVVVVSHGGVIGASFVALGGLSIGSADGLTRETKNTSITEWRRGDGGWRLVRYNDAAHLAGEPPR